jgi:hypothetical protein
LVKGTVDVKIHHSIFVLRDVSEQVFSGCGVQLKPDGRFEGCDITEDDPRWPRVAEAIARYQEVSEALRGFPIPGANGGDRVWTEFSDEERKLAPFLEMEAWYHGYPQPQQFRPDAPSRIDKLPYLRQTYDFSEACEKCWRGRKQIAPFRMKKNPTWGRRSILQLEWVREEFFVKPDVYESIFRPFGVGFRPVLLHKTGAELDTVVQLVIEAVAEVNVNGIPFEKCPACGKKDYHRSTKGFPPSPTDTKASLLKSNETFNGFTRRVYVSNSLWRRILDANLKGADFAPCGPA